MNTDKTLNTVIKLLVIGCLVVGGAVLIKTLLNVNRVTSNAKDLSDDAKADGQLLLREGTAAALEAIKERRGHRQD